MRKPERTDDAAKEIPQPAGCGCRRGVAATTACAGSEQLQLVGIAGCDVTGPSGLVDPMGGDEDDELARVVADTCGKACASPRTRFARACRLGVERACRRGRLRRGRRQNVAVSERE